MRTTNSRWLILSHAFNMDGRAASHTITDKIPYLRAAGVDPVVLSGVSGRPDAQIEHHQLWAPGPSGLLFDLRHVLARRWGRGLGYQSAMAAASALLLLPRLIEKLIEPMESSGSWRWSAYRKGLALIRERGIEVIYSTGGAYAAHLAAARLKRATGLPWVAEVHDPLVTPGSRLASRRERTKLAVERLICSEADVAIWFTEQALASARVRHPQLGERGHMMIPGVDAPDFELPPYQPSEHFVIGHFGSLSDSRHLGPLVEALESLRGRRDDLLSKLQVHIYGGSPDAISQARIAASPLRQQFVNYGRLENDPVTGKSGRDRILERMRGADVLLLLHGEMAECSEYIPSKLYEYLWMQRPVLAVVNRNPQMKAILASRDHLAVEHGDRDALARAIENLYDRWRSAGLPDDPRPSPWTTAASVHQLLGWVGQIAAGRKQGAAT